ncbi:MAG: tRNA dihydrouridine synthase DusB [Treponema sp.]|jgi:nifR3 family TIM-barrel protein|nr:tRNA dihydrouridine synthase DusB [Treponema sp.]
MSLYRPLCIGKLSLPGNLFLAPVAGYTDRAFRSICVEQGADFTYTELVSSEALVRGGVKTQSLFRRADNESRYCIQLFGSDPDVMYRATAMLTPQRPDLVDINCGCPVPKVVKTGSGAALTRDPERLARIVEAVVHASQEHLDNTPVSVKIRSGWDAQAINYRESASAAVAAGASIVALHARTRDQGYEGKSNWAHIADLASHVSVPVVGSGDLFAPQDAVAMLEQTACAAVMFARGALGNPFIFAETRSLLLTGSYEVPCLQDRIAVAFRQLALLASDVGEKSACLEMRKQFCAYTHGMTSAAELRSQLVHADTIDAYRALFPSLPAMLR